MLCLLVAPAWWYQRCFCNSQYRTISANVQCSIATVYNARCYKTCFCNSLYCTMIASLQCRIATAAMPGATRSSAPTISTPSMHPRPSCHQTGSLERTRCRENLISLLYYRHQLKGEDLKYGILLGVDAVLFYQFKDEASDIVWKRTKCCKNFFIRNLTCHTHTQRQS